MRPKNGVKTWPHLLFMMLLLSIPFSLNLPLHYFKLNIPLVLFQLEFPSELIIIPLVFWMIFRLYKHGSQVVMLLKHPIVMLGMFWNLWMILGIPFSSDPMFTLKYSVVSMSQWIVFFWGIWMLNIRPEQAVEKWFNFYTFSAGIIVIYATIQFYRHDFDIQSSVLIARPFYFDHALLSACLSLLAGIYGARLWVAFQSKKRKLSFAYLIIQAFLVAGIILSFSRAAWISFLISLVLIGVVILFKFSKLWSMLTLVGIIGVLAIILTVATSNQAAPTSSKPDNWLEHFSSITNFKDNVSNLERINRYRCAYRMFLDRPVIGFGAGTYRVAFLPYQKPEEMTRISVTTAGVHPPGRGGSAHSEYLRALSETGLPGFLILAGMVISVLITGLRIYFKSRHPCHGWYAIGILYGLCTFFVHGLFNNFLEQHKVSVLFWSMLMFLVLLDREMEDQAPNHQSEEI